MKNLFPIAAGVVLCLICTVVGFLIPQVSALAYITVSLACVTGLLCIGGILRHVTRGGSVYAPRSHKAAPPHSGGAAYLVEKASFFDGFTKSLHSFQDFLRFRSYTKGNRKGNESNHSFSCCFFTSSSLFSFFLQKQNVR